MDSASPIDARTAGQPTAHSGKATFGFSMGNTAEFAPAFDCDRQVHRYRGAHHPSAPGDGHAP